MLKPVEVFRRGQELPVGAGEGCESLWAIPECRTMAGPAELYSIVIAGSMNPRIHHPAWNETVQILSPEETRLALDRLVACTPMVSQFQFEGINILCSQERCEIQSQDPKKLDQMRDITGRTFDTLMHTPVNAFGLNFHFVRPTGLETVDRRLAELVKSLPLGHKAAPSDSAAIMTTTTLPDRVIQETVLGAPEAAGYVRVVYNVHHPIKPQPEGPSLS
jgi:hypothetical protein